MKKEIRILDIAQKAGVSIGTVDRVLHARGEVSRITRERILKIISDFNYRPNILASSLASKKTTIFASLTPWAAGKDAFWSKPQEGIDKAIGQIRQYGVRLQQFYFKMEDPETFTNEAEKILELSPDGILLAPWAKREALKFTQELDQRSIPYVFIDSNLKEANPISFIVQDSVQSGYLAAKLIDYGIPPQSNVLLIHITKDLQNADHLLEMLHQNKSDFLLNQKPESQGYVATNLLFDQIVRKEKVKNANYTSIDIITKENIEYYASI